MGGAAPATLAAPNRAIRVFANVEGQGLDERVVARGTSLGSGLAAVAPATHVSNCRAKWRLGVFMRSILKTLLRDERGQDLAEYGIALALIGSGAALGAIALAGNVSTVWSKASTMVAAAI